MKKKRYYNRTFTYILPMFGDSFLQFYKNHPYVKNLSVLKNCYLRSESFPDKENHMFIEYTICDYYEKFYEWIRDHDLFIDSKVIEDSEIFMFKIPITGERNYTHFMNSRFSLFDDEYKRHILKFHNLGLSSRVAKIIYKEESLYEELEMELNCDPIDRTQELGSLMELDKETHVLKKPLIKLKQTNKITFE